MRYEYECPECEAQWQIECRMSERPSSPPCPIEGCEGEGEQIFLRAPEFVVPNQPYKFDKRKNVMSTGRHFGRSDAQQHRDYQRAIDRNRVLLDRERRSCSGNKEDGIEFLGAMPGEMADSIGQHEGDKEIVNKDPIPFLKKTGLYTGRD